MFQLKSILIIFLVALTLSSCYHRTVVVTPRPHVHHLPPGHAKKIYGSKSAKHHAPGHHKHH